MPGTAKGACRRQHASFAPFRGLGDLWLEFHGFTVGYDQSLLHSYTWILNPILGSFPNFTIISLLEREG